MNKTEAQFWSIENILLAVCVLVGFALRIGNPSDLAFINDELSTWQKVSFDSLGAVIENIKLDDSHPVGMYVFMYFWTAIFGVSEFAIKLPFILMSLASMWLVYKIAESWFSKTTALFVLAYFCTLQFPIWWSTIARQYQSGLFCTLLMAYCWTKILIEQREEKRYWIGFVLMGAASMYNHYFSLLFAAWIGLTGFFWMRKEILWRYIGAGVLMILLFAPHIGITNYQLLNATGHTWYNVPDASFLSNHFFYIFHYNVWCWGLILLLLIASIILYGKESLKENNKSRMVALLWFLFPLLFGYFYSIYKAPILRESHLLFSFPYLLLLLLSFFPKELPNGIKVAVVLLILVLNSVTLIGHRGHFQTMNSHPYEHFIKNTKAFLEKYKAEDVTIVLGENPQYLQYYKDAYQTNFKHVESFIPPISFLELKAILQNSVTSHLIIGSLPETHVQMARHYYPYLYQKSYGINYEYYILSKNKELELDSLDIDFESTLSFDYARGGQGWTLGRNEVVQDTRTGNFYFQSQEEWGPTFIADLGKLSPRNNEILDIGLDVQSGDSLGTELKGVLVLEILNEQDSLISWRGVEIGQQVKEKEGWQRLYISLRFAHEPFYQDVKKLKMKTFFWNKEKQVILLDRFSVTLRKGNLILYGDVNNY